MTDIRTIEDQIRTRLDEIEKQMAPLRLEAEQLAKMAATFDGARTSPRPGTKSRNRPASPRTPRPTAGSPGAAKRGRPLGSGNRAQQAVAKIIDQPGITASELAKSMGISPNYLYRVLPRLEREAKVTKQGKGYHPAGDTVASAGKNGQPVNA